MPQLDRKVVELASETERNLVVLVIDWRAQVDADIEGLVQVHDEWDRVRDLLVGSTLERGPSTTIRSRTRESHQETSLENSSNRISRNSGSPGAAAAPGLSDVSFPP